MYAYFIVELFQFYYSNHVASEHSLAVFSGIGG